MTWILDDMVFNDIACVVSVNDLCNWPTSELVLADATAQAASLDGSGRRRLLLDARSPTGAAIFTTFSIPVDSTAGTILYTHLRTPTGTTANLAEHESIAWALTDQTRASVLVTRDKHAAMLALAELGNGRVCHPYEFFEHLYDQGCLARQQFEDLLNTTRRGDQSIPIPWRLSS